MKYHVDYSPIIVVFPVVIVKNRDITIPSYVHFKQQNTLTQYPDLERFH